MVATEYPCHNIVIADALPVVRQGLRQVLAQANDTYHLHEAATLPQLLELAQRVAPAVVLTGADLPGAPADVVDLLSTVRKAHPHVAVVILTDPVSTPELSIIRLLRQGINGLVARAAPVEEICEMVRLVLEHGRFYNQETMALLQQQLGRTTKLPQQKTDFTARQIEILHLVARDHSSEEIAEYLCTSVRTVEYHRSQMLQKANVRTTLGLVLYAIRQGIVSEKSLRAFALNHAADAATK
jgi:DNA-binding NarL/FixJ family response regulator